MIVLKIPEKKKLKGLFFCDSVEFIARQALHSLYFLTLIECEAFAWLWNSENRKEKLTNLSIL